MWTIHTCARLADIPMPYAKNLFGVFFLWKVKCFHKYCFFLLYNLWNKFHVVFRRSFVCSSALFMAPYRFSDYTCNDDFSQHLVDISTENKNMYSVCDRVICAGVAGAATAAAGDAIIYHLIHLFMHCSPFVSPYMPVDAWHVNYLFFSDHFIENS